ncbi:MAG: hypothetical protein K8R99_08035 [Actinomycetia bacterium]|nr:hypothetical protein [Actinomycetes bacterium]
MASTVVRRLFPAALAPVLLAIALTAGCSGENPYQSAASAETSPALTGDNEFLPARDNVSDCIGAVERPDCGSESKGGWQLYLTFGFLLAGIGFIGWRVVRSVRARDAAIAPPIEPPVEP